ncbi:hypothetical protein ILUMI_10823 [Ignelater luminosus]|uniref:PiggyBac transposable element-derived protein domain-containing protein n=1 Tax=Ignelater luminosus TaxID=2038154 RepID=A0A8K0GDT5_IGNLU|nr:hypothetical protein ILUMI_10823 [Ignelater luminosus]
MNDGSKDFAENGDLGEDSDIDEMDKVEQDESDSSTEQDGEDLFLDEDDSSATGFYWFVVFNKCLQIKSSCLEELWGQDGDGIERSSLVMSIKRFKILTRCLRFGDRITRSKRKAFDYFAPIRDVFEKFVKNCQSFYSPGENVTIDEMFPSFRSKCSFGQCIPSRPTKYGIKLFALVDAEVICTFNMEIYAGKQPEGLFCVSNKPPDVAKRMAAPLFGFGRNITDDY